MDVGFANIDESSAEMDRLWLTSNPPVAVELADAPITVVFLEVIDNELESPNPQVTLEKEGERAWLSTEILESSFGLFKDLEGQHAKAASRA